jgi:hypothetical protein
MQIIKKIDRYSDTSLVSVQMHCERSNNGTITVSIFAYMEEAWHGKKG